MRQRLRHHHHRRGLTMVETIAAIVILAVAIPPMLWSLAQAHHQRVSPTQASIARWLAAEKLEDIIADRFGRDQRFDYLIASNYPDENPTAGFSAFTRTVSFTPVAHDLSSPGTDYVRVTVTVSWTDAASKARTLSLSTVLADY